MLRKPGKIFAASIIAVLMICFAGFSFAADSKGKININEAGLEELTQLDGVGTSIAERIIRYRDANGGFENADEIINVKGIGPKTLADNIERITVSPPASE